MFSVANKKIWWRHFFMGSRDRESATLYYSEKIGIEKVSYATYTLIQKLENSGHLFTRVPGGKTTIFLAKLQSVFVSKNDYGTLP